MHAADPSNKAPLDDSQLDDFGDDLYAIPGLGPAHLSNPTVNVSTREEREEDRRIRELVETPDLDGRRRREVEDTVEVFQQPSSFCAADSSYKFDEFQLVDFEDDLYAIPGRGPAHLCYPAVDVSTREETEEDRRIKELVETPDLDWKSGACDTYGQRHQGKGMRGRRTNVFGRRLLGSKTPPQGYVCRRCKEPGHFIQHCSTNGDPAYDIKKMRMPIGVPKDMLVANAEGHYLLPSGDAAVMIPDEAAFDKAIGGLPTTHHIYDLPPELHCPLCKQTMRDAMITLCCFKSFCANCIRDYILLKTTCICGAPNVRADDPLPNLTLRNLINWFGSSSSSLSSHSSVVSANPGHLQAIESTKAQSLSLSAGSKDEDKLLPAADFQVVKNSGSRDEEKSVITVDCLDSKTINRNNNYSEEKPMLLSSKKTAPQKSISLPEEIQEKKFGSEQGKRNSAAVQLGVREDFDSRGSAGMPPMLSTYSPYMAAGGMPLDFDGCTRPYMGYTPGPFGFPYGGNYPFNFSAAQSYMLPVSPQRVKSHFNTKNINWEHPVKSREKFEARKADPRKKPKFEQLDGRERGLEKKWSSHVDVSLQNLKPMRVAHSIGHKKVNLPAKATSSHSRNHDQDNTSGLRKLKGSRSPDSSSRSDGSEMRRKSSSTLRGGYEERKPGHIHRHSISIADDRQPTMRSISSYDDGSSDEEELHFKRKPSWW